MKRRATRLAEEDFLANIIGNPYEDEPQTMTLMNSGQNFMKSGSDFRPAT